jgi:hypothetical protein
MVGMMDDLPLFAFTEYAQARASRKKCVLSNGEAK